MIKDAVYDLETFSNCFTAVFLDVKTRREKEFVIHEDWNDLRKFIKFLKKIHQTNYRLIGYNCIRFDAQILEFIIENYKKFKHWSGNVIAEEIYKKAQFIINLDESERHLHSIAEWNLQIPHLDIFKQKHYDGKQKRCSLKWLEFTMRFPNIESMPFHHSRRISFEEIPLILRYNRNDVRATDRSYEINRFETELRESLSQEYDIPLLNASEPKMARDIFAKFLCEDMEITYRELRQMQTHRNWIDIKDVIFDYINFNDRVLKGALKFYEGLGFNPNFIKKSPDNNTYGLDKIERKFKLYNFPEVVMGLGGLHACVNPTIVNAKPNWVVRDIDVTSYYPNLAIENDLFPKHLSLAFCKTYKKIFDIRQTIDKKDPRNYALKIVLNSAYGLSNEQHGYLYDPQYTFSITVNGQLLLLKLAELLKKYVPSLMFYQLNTDGVTIGYDPKDAVGVEEAMTRWKNRTRLKLEDKYYSKMVIVDVNNYLAIDTKGGVKRKGLFGYSLNPEDKEMDYHKNPSELIVPKALEKYFVDGIDVKETIMKHDDIYDFCLGVKIKRDFELSEYYYDATDNRIKKRKIDQTVVRYFVSKSTEKLKKEYTKEYMAEHLAKLEEKGKKGKNSKSSELSAGWNTSLFNVYKEKKMPEYKIDYQYYIQEARKVIDQVEPNVKQIKMFE